MRESLDVLNGMCFVKGDRERAIEIGRTTIVTANHITSYDMLSIYLSFESYFNVWHKLNGNKYFESECEKKKKQEEKNQPHAGLTNDVIQYA